MAIAEVKCGSDETDVYADEYGMWIRQKTECDGEQTILLMKAKHAKRMIAAIQFVAKHHGWEV